MPSRRSGHRAAAAPTAGAAQKATYTIVITTPTTLVVGAGASKPYGLPTGPELLDKARRLAPGSLDGVFEPLVDALGVGTAELNGVLEEIRRHKAPTLDAVLEQRPDLDRYITPMFAALMHVELEQIEIRGRAPEDHDWLRVLAERLRDGSGSDWRQFHHVNRGLRIVTFNIDSLLQTAIANTVRRLFKDCDEEAAADMAGRFDIIHVHGRLPAANVLEPEWVATASEGIHLSRNGAGDADGGPMAAARSAIREAEVVCFLGFGYHRTNLDRLAVAEAVRSKAPNAVFGSALDVPDGLREWITGKVPGIRLADRNETCVDVLDRFYVFRD